VDFAFRVLTNVVVDANESVFYLCGKQKGISLDALLLASDHQGILSTTEANILADATQYENLLLLNQP